MILDNFYMQLFNAILPVLRTEIERSLIFRSPLPDAVVPVATIKGNISPKSKCSYTETEYDNIDFCIILGDKNYFNNCICGDRTVLIIQILKDGLIPDMIDSIYNAFYRAIKYYIKMKNIMVSPKIYAAICTIYIFHCSGIQLEFKEFKDTISPISEVIKEYKIDEDVYNKILDPEDGYTIQDLILNNYIYLFL